MVVKHFLFFFIVSISAPWAKTIVTLPSAPSAYYTVYYTALARGFFAKNRLDIETRYAPEMNAVADVSEGRVDIALTSVASLAGIKAANPHNSASAFMSYGAGHPGRLLARGITDISDLVGKKVGVKTLFGPEYIWLRHLLKTNNPRLAKTVNIVEVAGSLPEAFDLGLVDAIVTPSLESPAESLANRLFIRSTMETNPIPGYVFVYNMILPDRSKLAKAFRNAMSEAYFYLMTHPNAAFPIKSAYAPKDAMSKSELIDLMRSHNFTYLGRIDVPALARFLALVEEIWPTRRAITAYDLIDITTVG